MNPQYATQSPKNGGQAVANRAFSSPEGTEQGIYDNRPAALAQRVLMGNLQTGSHSNAPVQRYLDPEEARKDIPKTKVYLNANYKKLKAEFEKEIPLHDLHQELEARFGNYNGNKTDDNLIAVLECLNEIEKELELKAKEDARRGTVLPVNEILIGTEFTFTNENLHRLKLNENYDAKTKEGKGKKKAQEAIAGEAVTYIREWAGKVKGRVPKPLEMRSSDVNAKDGTQRAIKFEYFDEGVPVFYWVLDMDDGCLETQTMPSSFDKLKGSLIKQIIEENIFKIGAELGLVPDDEIGGGHLSFDASSMVGKSPALLLSLLETLQDGVPYWQGMFKDGDDLNASWMSEMVLRKDHNEDAFGAYKLLLKDLMEKARKSEIEMPAVIQALKEFNGTVISKKITEMEKERLTPEVKAALGNIKGEPNHYQAVNIEHLDKDGGEARLELRRIRAQKSYEELMQQIDFILKKFIELSRL